jgi:soluble lytic murein transglycosylase-like protein
MQSDLSPVEPAAVALLPQIGSTLERLWLGLTFHHAAPPTVSSPNDTKAVAVAAPSIPLLTKAETLLLIAEAAIKHRVPAAFVTSIVAAESNFDCAAISPRGAVGLMQLMPETARQFGANPAVPAENIDAGTQYLGWLMKRYEKRRDSIKHVIAAYNAGPGMVDRYRGVPPFRETRAYVTRVLGFLKQFSPSRTNARATAQSVTAQSRRKTQSRTVTASAAF